MDTLSRRQFEHASKLHPTLRIIPFIPPQLLPVTPTKDTLSFFVIYLCSHIEPCLVDSYLSRICYELKEFFPDIRCMHSFRLPINQKHTLTITDLALVHQNLGTLSSLDDMLFVTMLLTGFYALLCLKKMFLLSAHKADPLFEGSCVLVTTQNYPDPMSVFMCYLAKCNALYPWYPQLWLTNRGKVPHHAWFMSYLNRFFLKNVAGHSLHSGGTTALAERGVHSKLIPN
ncbi:hypothetical protein OBBRIDRAFT_813029 [Obba rivulosa]|uniref:Uncharacterized protein n=1 Tax=Obba rivulosa TaxID=1052685 RepID=A0A8E2DLE1_9APHY|nr:hypothetical protein OBBRIDRAFT_813029 [Obba rivulosa]